MLLELLSLSMVPCCVLGDRGSQVGGSIEKRAAVDNGRKIGSLTSVERDE